jgi:hypothetical protein
MRRLLTGAAAVALVLALATVAEAGRGGGRGGHGGGGRGGHSGRHQGGHGRGHGGRHDHYGRHHGHRGRGHVHGRHGHRAYHGRHHRHWSRTCWSRKYGCECYWDPSGGCWYYWCEPQDCYFPISSYDDYPPEAPATAVTLTSPPACRRPTPTATRCGPDRRPPRPGTSLPRAGGPLSSTPEDASKDGPPRQRPRALGPGGGVAITSMSAVPFPTFPRRVAGPPPLPRRWLS